MTINWGIIATGRIARTFADALPESKTGKLVACASRSLESAEAFASDYEGIKAYGTYLELLEDSDVDAVYISTPHPQHAEWCIRALDAGKAVLCEKPLGLNHAEVMAMTNAARRNNTFLMEAFMYRTHPQTQRVVELIENGTIGEVRHIEANFGYHAPFNADSRLFSNALAGGGIMDVGCYPMSLARLIAGEPISISAHGHLGETGVDEWSAALVKFAGGVSAQIATSVSLGMRNDARIYGSKGQIHIPSPWNPNDAEGNWRLSLITDEKETITGHTPSIYALEADAVGEALATGATESNAMSWADSRGNALALDSWRSAIRLTYQSEAPATHSGPVLGQLKRNDKQTLGTRTLPCLEKPISKLVMGCDNQPSMSHAAVMWDDFYSQGGNCFDTAHIYGGGSMEKLLGHWHTQRNLREEIVIIGKGAHSPNCFPNAIGEELDISLGRLQTDYVDIYFMHRDNLDIPIGEFVEAMNEEVKKGRIKVIGVSNWTLERILEANTYAEAHGLTGIQAISNQFSLATMREPIWPGTHVATDDDFVQFLTETQTPLFPWSSQARGFFTEFTDQVMNAHAATEPHLHATTMEPNAQELARVWFEETNFGRRGRAIQLASQKGVEPIEIALAYVLAQPFPAQPLVGPRSLEELDSCILASELELTNEEVAYLRDGDGQ